VKRGKKGAKSKKGAKIFKRGWFWEPWLRPILSDVRGNTFFTRPKWTKKLCTNAQTY
jgi:hypothetical protein